MMTPTLQHLVEATNIVCGMQDGELMGYCRERRIVEVRQAVHWLAVRKKGLSICMVGKFFKRDHTTILYSLRSVDRRLINGNKDYMNLIDDIWNTAGSIAKGVRPARRLKKVLVAPPAEPKRIVPPCVPVVPKPLKHWSHYEVASLDWYAANDRAFRQGLQAASARVLIEAGE